MAALSSSESTTASPLPNRGLPREEGASSDSLALWGSVAARGSPGDESLKGEFLGEETAGSIGYRKNVSGEDASSSANLTVRMLILRKSWEASLGIGMLIFHPTSSLLKGYEMRNELQTTIGFLSYDLDIEQRLSSKDEGASSHLVPFMFLFLAVHCVTLNFRLGAFLKSQFCWKL